MLPPLVAGKDKACFAVTEPDAGLDTLNLKTRAERTNSGYVISGQKIWISTAQVASKMLILARTTPADQVKRRTEGLSLFYTDLDRRHVEAREIDKMGRKAVDSNQLFIDALPVPAEDRIGEEGRGFDYILHGMNPERVLIAAEAVGLGRAALDRARALCRRTRRVRPPDRAEPVDPAPARRMLDGARGREPDGVQGRLALRRRQACGAEANAAKYLAAEAAFKTCQTAIMTHGGMGYAKEYHVERYLREALIARIAPVSPQMILNFIAEKVLGLPKSY